MLKNAFFIKIIKKRNKRILHLCLKVVLYKSLAGLVKLKIFPLENTKH